jgi:DNA-binding GntR family transcriptional regulator
MHDRSALQEQTYSRLRRKIIEGTIEPGQRLSEPELAAMFGVSRSPIREAILRLERDGFVVRGPSGRLSVAPLDVDEMQQLYVVRANLEGLATRCAASRLRTIDLDEMTLHLEANLRAVEERDGPTAARAGQAFHEIILRECGNKPLVDVLIHFQSRINRFRMIAVSFENYDTARIEEHRQVLALLYDRQPERAEAMMIEHIQNSGAALLVNVKRMLDKQEVEATV